MRGWANVLILKLEAQMAALTGDAGEIASPAGLFDRIASAVAREASAVSGLHRLAFADGEWTNYSEGIEVKYLWDKETFLVRCLPGAVIPPHGHDLTEYLIAVSGDLIIDGVEFGLGDYHSMPPGTRHDDAWTRQGCIFLCSPAPRSTELFLPPQPGRWAIRSVSRPRAQC